jgi:hypothetical protein
MRPLQFIKTTFVKHREAVYFLLILAVLMVLLSAVTAPHPDPVYNIVEASRDLYCFDKEEKAEWPLDILISGNSTVYYGLSPEVLWNSRGVTSHNLGTPALRLADSYAVLRKALLKQHPKAVILETNSFYKDEGLKTEYLDNLSGQYKDAVIFNAYAAAFPVLRNHAVYKYLLLPETDSETGNFHGSTGKDTVYALEQLPSQYSDQTVEKQPIPDDNLVYLNKINALCRQNGTDLILVSIPTTNDWDFGKDKGIREWAENNRRRYIDMNLPEYKQKVKIDWKKDTFDGGDHLNRAGAAKVSKYLGRYLQKKYRLTDHRDEVKYAGWANE